MLWLLVVSRFLNCRGGGISVPRDVLGRSLWLFVTVCL